MSYVEVGGVRTWHEIDGAGEPVVLLHGGFAGADSWFCQRPALAAAGFRVYVPERRGHAHTPDVDGPISYAVMTDDTIAYLEAVIETPAHLVGWSDGAVVALMVATRRPDLVKRMVLIGQYYNANGKAPGGIVDAVLANLDGAKQFLRGGYDPVSPDGPEHFDVIFDKMLVMVTTEPELDLADFDAVVVQTLVVQGDRDDVTIDHSVAVVSALGDARLAVLPGTHALPIESPELLNPLLVSFLRDGSPAGWSASFC